MFAPDWQEGCKSCAFWADQFDPAVNYQPGLHYGEHAPGVSVFARDDGGEIYHTYSCYARGLDVLNGAYQLLDLLPAGRAETGLPYPMDWLRLHDRYD